MGANVCADGNTNGVPNVPTERVSNIRPVEEELIAPFVSGRRNWTELFRAVFKEEFPGEVHNIDRMVLISLGRLRRGYVPVCVMNRYRADVAFHAHSHHK